MESNFSNPQINLGEKNQKSNHPARIPFGIMLVLLGVAGLLNRFLIAYVNYGLIFVFGTLYFIIYFGLIIFGSSIILRRDNLFGKWNISTTGFLLILLAISMFGSYYLYGLENVGPASLNNVIPVIKTHALEGRAFKDVLQNPLTFGFRGGGIIADGFYVILASSISRVGALLIIILLFLVGIALLFWQNIKAVYEKYTQTRSNKQERKQYFQNAATLDSSPKNQPSRYMYGERKVEPVEIEAEQPYIPASTSELVYSFGFKKAIFKGPRVKESEVSEVETEQIVKEIEPEIETPTIKYYEEEIETPPKKVEHELPLYMRRKEEPKEEQTRLPLDNDKVNEPLEQQTPQSEPEISLVPDPIVKEPEPIYTKQKVKEQPKPQAKKYEYPPVDILAEYSNEDYIEKNTILADERLKIINQTFENFKVGASAISYTIGPSVTQFDIQMEPTETVASVRKIINDLSSRVGGVLARFEEIVAGRSTSALEIANNEPATVGFKECLLDLPKIKSEKERLLIPFGKNISGKVISARIDQTPHMLVAGATGSGKSVFIHSLIMTLIMRNTPSEVKLMIIDPKRVEMSKYRDIPHLMCPIITDYDEAKVAMDKLVQEMENRYDLLVETGCSKLSDFNEVAADYGYEPLPVLVVIIDEYADLVEGAKDIATPVVRIAQKSRAAGIHLVIATQRPSVNVITGVIKANLPTRVALSVASPADSLTILGSGGAETLLGRGDMLVDSPLISNQGLVRLQGAFVDDKEIIAVARFLKQRYPTEYMEEFLDLKDRSAAGAEFGGLIRQEKDERYDEIKAWVLTQDYISINRIQTNFGMGFSRASRIFNMLKDNDIVESGGESNSAKGSKVIASDMRSPEEKRIDNNEY